jgi:hypothetical protein
VDDTDLRRRLDDTIGRLQPPPVPVETITRRGRVITRRRAGLAVAAVAGAAAAVVALLPGGPSVRTAPPPATSGSNTSGADVTNYPAPAGWDLFAAGTANGHPWRLNVSDVADSGGACIPAVVLNGQDADVLVPPSGLVPPPGPPSVLTGTTDAPGTSFAFFQVPPSVTRLDVSAGTAMRLTLTPVTETVCGKRFRLAGFGFDSVDAVRVNAYPSGAGYALPASLIKLSPYPQQLDGQWQNLDQSASLGTPRRVTAGTIAGRPWNIDLQLGGKGECFSLNVPPAADTGITTICGMLVVGSQFFYELPSAHIGAATIYGDVFPLGTQDCSQVSVKLADGRTLTVTPVTVWGLRVVAFAAASPATGVTFKDAAGNIISSGSLTAPGG